MININAEGLDFSLLNKKIKSSTENVKIMNCEGQRFIGAAADSKTINIYGTPGNALGSYLDGAKINVYGDAQDATGDTMNNGIIVINGNCGDALGYSMRGGKIFVKKNTGYRTGIHMKEYKDKKPVIVIGGSAGSFLGEYLAGGCIIVLGIGYEESDIVGNFTCTGIHGGRVFLRTKRIPKNLPPQVICETASDVDKKSIKVDLLSFCKKFEYDFDNIYNSDFLVLKPNAKNPYKKLYVAN